MSFDPIGFLRAAEVLPAAAEARAQRLEGGYWNEVVRVRCGADDLVVKHFGGTRVASTLVPILPESEARALEILAGRAVAPDPVGFWPAGDEHGAVLVYRYVPGEMWQGDVVEAAALLRRVHAVAPDGFRALPVTPEEVLADADRLPRPHAGDAAWRRLQAVRPAPRPVPELSRRSLVHADFSAGNMISGPEGARAIDWQCPGAGDPAEDLWSFLAPCFQIVYDRLPWRSGDIARFRDAYGETATLARLDAMTPFFSYRYAAYSVFRTAQLAEIDEAASDRYRRCAEAETLMLESLMTTG